MYWIYNGVGGLWENNLLQKMEIKVIGFIENEIRDQKEFEKKRDARTDDKLQSINLHDLLTIAKIYERDI